MPSLDLALQAPQVVVADFRYHDNQKPMAELLCMHHRQQDLGRKIVHIDLSATNVEVSNLQEVVDDADFAENLKSLSVAKCPYIPTWRLQPAILGARNLVFLDLSGRAHGDIAIVATLCFELMERLEFVNLSGCCASPAHFSLMCEMIAEHPSVEVLILDRLDPLHRGDRLHWYALRHTLSLSHLSISETDITIGALFCVVVHNVFLTDLRKDDLLKKPAHETVLDCEFLRHSDEAKRHDGHLNSSPLRDADMLANFDPGFGSDIISESLATLANYVKADSGGWVSF